MAYDLFIIEAPGKCRVLEELLKKAGFEAKVQATSGHMYSFPDKLNDLGIDKGFRDFKRVLVKVDAAKYIRDAAADAKTIYIATDADREGDVIAWDVAELIGDIQPETFRVRLKGMDLESVKRAIAEMTPVRKEDAVPGRTRAIVDRMIGATFSHDGVRVGRIVTSLLGICRDEKLPVHKLQLSAPAADGGRHWMTETDVLDPISLKIAKELEKVEFPILDKKRESKPFTAKPKHTGDILVRAGDVMRLTPIKAQQEMQNLYEAGQLSYPRAGSRGLSPAIAEKIANIVKKSGYHFQADKVADKTASDAHDAPYPIGPVNVAHDPEKLGDQEGMRAMIARDLVKTGQSHVVEEAFGQTAGDHLRKLGYSDAISDHVAKLPWRREKGPRFPGQESWPENRVTTRLPDTVLLEAAIKKGLGRPSTWGRHIEQFMKDGLVDKELNLTAKGKKWIDESPEMLLDPRLSAAIENACDKVSEKLMNDPDREPWELSAERIVMALPDSLKMPLFKGIADEPLRPKEDQTAMFKSTVGLDEVLEQVKKKDYNYGPKGPSFEEY